MLICFRCPGSTKKAMDELVGAGAYADYSEVVQAAVANLATLHDELGDGNSLVLGQPGQVANRKGAAGEPPSGPATGIPHLFMSDGLVKPRTLAQLPADRWQSGQPVPLEEWVFGQYNRLLPAKANCRALAHMLEGSPQGVLAAQAADMIAREAGVLGDLLRKHDKRHSLGRDERLATAFPKTGVGTEKSRVRYADQFVGYVDSKRRVHGLLIDYKLINQTDGDEPRLLLTEPGWEFAAMANPVLDVRDGEPARKFTEEELMFLLGHLGEHVPRERFAHEAIRGALADGNRTPDAIDEALLVHAADGAKESDRASFFALQRSGALCRMLDLGIVARKRKGLHVTYVKVGTE